MIDLTPLEVRKKKGDFRRVMRGYEAGPVDDFLDLAADRMDELVRENAQLNDRVRRLEEQVRDYRDRERALTEALVTAQEMREEMREQSSREAEIAKREAEAEAERIRHDAELARDRELEAIRQLRERQHQLVAGYRVLLERELAEITVVARSLEASLGVSPATDVTASQDADTARPARPDDDSTAAAASVAADLPQPAAPVETGVGTAASATPVPAAAEPPAPRGPEPSETDAGQHEPTIFDLPLRSRKLFDAADVESILEGTDSPLSPRPDTGAGRPPSERATPAPVRSGSEPLPPAQAAPPSPAQATPSPPPPQQQRADRAEPTRRPPEQRPFRFSFEDEGS
jgi:cell division initiation protein